MSADQNRFAGIDVGGRRKGFHLAVIEGARVVGLEEYRGVGGLVERLVEVGPQAVGIDSPPEWAPDGEKSRPAEREFVGRKVCGIRYTPDRAAAEAHAGNYYEWIFNGMALWEGLGEAGFQGKSFEVFPTASWTIWHGPRGKRNREEWSQEALEALPLELPEVEWTQDFRDAVAAAWTVALLESGRAEEIGAGRTEARETGLVLPLGPES